MSKYIPLPSERQGTDDSFSRSPKKLTERLGLRSNTKKKHSSNSESTIGLLDSSDTPPDLEGNYRQDRSVLFEDSSTVENNLPESTSANKKINENGNNGIISIQITEKKFSYYTIHW